MSARGYTRDLAALRADYEFEEAAVRRYGPMANEVGEPALKELFKELAPRRGRPSPRLAPHDRQRRGPAAPVVLFCPLCGWQIDFGPDPAEGAQGKCAMCPGRFALRLDADGDWALERLAP